MGAARRDGACARSLQDSQELTTSNLNLPHVHHSDANPFSTTRVRPGTLAFRFLDGRDIAQVAREFELHDGRGQIVGPHGSGKSTLVRELAGELRRAGWTVELWRVRPGRRIEIEPATYSSSEIGEAGPTRARRVRIVDGYEQLNVWARWRLAAWRWWHHAGLLVTSHTDAGFPDLVRTRVTIELAQSVVSTLLADFPPLVSPADVDAAYARNPDNLREILFELYDLYETRRTGRQSPKTT